MVGCSLPAGAVGVPTTGVPVDTPVWEQDCGVLEGSPAPGEAAGVAWAPRELPAAPGWGTSQSGGSRPEPAPHSTVASGTSGDAEHLEVRRPRPDLGLDEVATRGSGSLRSVAMASVTDASPMVRRRRPESRR